MKAPNGYAWGTGELDTSVFTIVTVPDDEENIEYSVYPREDFINKVGDMGVGVFRHKNFSRRNLKQTLRRKYKFNQVTQKIEGKI